MARSRLHRNERKISQKHDTKMSSVHWIFPTGRERRAKRLDRPQSGHHGAELAYKNWNSAEIEAKKQKTGDEIQFNTTPGSWKTRRIFYRSWYRAWRTRLQMRRHLIRLTKSWKLHTTLPWRASFRQQRQQSHILPWEDERVLQLKRS